MPGWLLALLGGGVTTLAMGALAIWQWQRARSASALLASSRALAAAQSLHRQQETDRANRAEWGLAEATVRTAEVISRHAKALEFARGETANLRAGLAQLVAKKKGDLDVIAWAAADASARLSIGTEPSPPPDAAAGRGADPAVPDPAEPDRGLGAKRP